jgi:glutaconate CoA-transferase subunit B
MTDTTDDVSLAELLVVACSEVWRGDGEILATGIGPLPRLGASLAKLTFAPQLMMTDGEAYLIEDPVPLGPRGDSEPGKSGSMTYARVFDLLWSGRRHALVGPTQLDRFGQSNLSALGPYDKPKVQMLGVRGYPGNSVSHANSFFVPSHDKRVFVADEVDMVCSAGFNPKNWPGAVLPKRLPDIRFVVTDLCVMDFRGPGSAPRVVSLHPGVTFEQVAAATGFPLLRADDLRTTPLPTADQLAIMRQLDPKNIRATVLKGNPPAKRAA